MIRRGGARSAALGFALMGTALAAVVALDGCASFARDARYTGDVTPQGACGTASHGTLTATGTRVAFTPTDGVLLLRGERAADGTAKAELTTEGAGGAGAAALPGETAKPGAKAPDAKSGAKRPYVMSFAGTVTDEAAIGTYTTPRCAFTVNLARVHPPIF